MKAISVKQPWATLIAHGFKDIENRTWMTRQRGTVLIHASKGMTLNEWDHAMEFAAPMLRAAMELVGDWVLVDITLRMLKPPELFAAQSFPASYIIHEIPDPKLLFVDGKQVVGNPLLIPRIPLTGTAQVRMCGNSVAPAQAEALARANFKHEALIYGRQAA